MPLRQASASDRAGQTATYNTVTPPYGSRSTAEAGGPTRGPRGPHGLTDFSRHDSVAPLHLVPPTQQLRRAHSVMATGAPPLPQWGQQELPSLTGKDCPEALLQVARRSAFDQQQMITRLVAGGGYSSAQAALNEAAHNQHMYLYRQASIGHWRLYLNDLRGHLSKVIELQPPGPAAHREVVNLIRCVDSFTLSPKSPFMERGVPITAIFLWLRANGYQRETICLFTDRGLSLANLCHWLLINGWPVAALTLSCDLAANFARLASTLQNERSAALRNIIEAYSTAVVRLHDAARNSHYISASQEPEDVVRLRLMWLHSVGQGEQACRFAMEFTSLHDGLHRLMTTWLQRLPEFPCTTTSVGYGQGRSLAIPAGNAASFIPAAP